MDSFTGIRDLDILILSYLDDKSLIRSRSLNKYMKNLYEEEQLWKLKVQKSDVPKLCPTFRESYFKYLKNHAYYVCCEPNREDSMIFSNINNAYSYFMEISKDKADDHGICLCFFEYGVPFVCSDNAVLLIDGGGYFSVQVPNILIKDFSFSEAEFYVPENIIVMCDGLRNDCLPILLIFDSWDKRLVEHLTNIAKECDKDRSMIYWKINTKKREFNEYYWDHEINNFRTFDNFF